MRQFVKFPITNFFLADRDSIRISENISVGKIPKAESDFFSGIELSKRGSDRRLLLDLKFAIEQWIETQDDRGTPQEIRNQWKLADDLLLALRLFEGDGIGLSFAYIIRGPFLTLYEKYPLRIPWIEDRFRLGFTISREESMCFLQFWKKLQVTLAAEPQLKISTQLFNKAMGAITWEDKLVQCMASFETLMLSAEERRVSSKGPLISRRVAEKLGDEKDKLTIERDMRRGYMIRNVIVHGNMSELNMYTIGEKISLCYIVENYLRRSFRAFIDA